MRILVLTSRYTATRDIISEDFGRQVRLFAALKKRGHDIDFYCADYRKFEHKDVRLHGITVFIRRCCPLSFIPFCLALKSQLEKKKYDVLIATSDPLWGVIGRWAAHKTKTPFIYDLHDNYETYVSYKIPFLPFLEKKVIIGADMVTTVSHALKEKIAKIRTEGVAMIQNGADIKVFRPLSKGLCRKELNLPKDALLIGYAGSIQRGQGIDILIRVVMDIRKKMPKVQLLIAGKFYGNEKKHINLGQEGIISLGSLSQAKIVKLINACDVVVVPNRKNSFTEFCFPYKVVEYMACNVPIVATRVGDVSRILKKFPKSLCEPDDAASMKAVISSQMEKGRIPYRKHMMDNTWDAIAKEFDKVLRQGIKKAKG